MGKCASQQERDMRAQETLFFCYTNILQGLREKRTERLMWHLTFPPRACARSTKFPRSSVHLQAHISDGLKESSRSFKYLPRAYTSISSGKGLQCTVSYASYNVLCQRNQLDPSPWFWQVPWRMSWAPVTSGALRRPGQTLPERDVLRQVAASWLDENASCLPNLSSFLFLTKTTHIYLVMCPAFKKTPKNTNNKRQLPI